MGGTSTRPAVARIVAAAGVVLAAGALAGCADVRSPEALTIAVTATSAEPRPSLAAVEDLVADHAAASLLPGDGMVRLVVQGDPEVHEVDLTPMRGDDVEADFARIDEKVAENLAVLEDDLAGAAAATDGNDVLGVLDRALEATPEGGRVILMGSGLSTVDPVDLTKAGAWIQDPEAFAATVDAANLPDAAGKHVTFAGLGYAVPAGPQRTAGPASRDALTALWGALCEASGAASCDFVDGQPAASAPAATNVVPIVELDQLETACIGGATIDGNVSFGGDSAELTPAGVAAIAPIAQSLKTCTAGQVVHGVGHAAEVPGSDDGVELSLARCEAVFAELRRAGVPEEVLGDCVGLGSREGQIVDNTPDGVFDEALAKLNRVVELTVEQG
ncbi:hypothetical protein ACDF64_05055 [Agromyces sp. MMS24-JH15]|uniref:hypothetical protein n=1 Tax=Agromyces sp. MMS24-JH15 TaxID=3243765 RepID=UPI003748AB5A